MLQNISSKYWHENKARTAFAFLCFVGTTRGDQKVLGKVLFNFIAFIDCNENS